MRNCQALMSPKRTAATSRARRNHCDPAQTGHRPQWQGGVRRRTEHARLAGAAPYFEGDTGANVVRQSTRICAPLLRQ